MYDNEYFVVDMMSCTTTGEIINSLSLALETLNHSGKKIILKLNDSYLNQSQMLSIQSLITSYGCLLDTVETTNDDTLKVVEGMNISVQRPAEKSDDIENKETFVSFDIEKKDDENNGISDEIKPSIDNIDDVEDDNPSLDVENTDTDEQEVFNNEDKQETIENPLNDTPINDINNSFDLSEKMGDVSKNTIGVYKKAYDENEITSDAWEEVDFYETATNEPIITDTKETTYINSTLRSGQILESQGNVVIIGDCHPGSEIRAVGDITVWGVLSGIAHAGCNGNINAKVRALKLNAVQLRIGSCYSRRPDGTNIPYIIKSSIFTPEEARVVNNEIMLFKINQN